MNTEYNNKRAMLNPDTDYILFSTTPRAFATAFNEWNKNAYEQSVPPMTLEEASDFIIDNPTEVTEALLDERNFEFFYNDLFELQDEEGNRE